MNKYRVWDRKLNGYFSDDLLISCDGDVMTWGVFSVESHDRPEDLIIERYTGLKDKNGVEIYEGDIVSVRDSPVVVEDEEGVCYVAWNSVLAGFLLKGSDAYKFDEQSLSDLKLIVIGNIHEDAELLEKII